MRYLFYFNTRSYNSLTDLSKSDPNKHSKINALNHPPHRSTPSTKATNDTITKTTRWKE